MEIDLNADVGEGFGPYRMGDDEAMFDIVSSINIACGYHAGDPVIMDRTVRLAGAKGIDLGAHVGFPDLLGFGRRPIQVDPLELAKYVLYQMGALEGIARAAGHRLTHMSFHGALGNMAAASYELAEPLVRAVAEFDRNLVISVSTNTEIERAADRIGVRTANTFLADRAYDDQGALVSRKLAGAVIKDRAAVLARVQQLLEEGTVTTIAGNPLRMNARSILLHGDTPGAVELARMVRSAIEAAGGRVVPVSNLVKRSSPS
ncbi:5-oxoprolinase subunit PxpA [Burkholderia sp. Ac-20344]|uniref:LamB/YcsF family protein n=1 Tax=Burkholderia sp. Ac-20344 TaxID=2703890 RepID=UPI00197BDE16|nr:5-oxoprolinase subunit PxpA [Burkholderia sp. Ac-20344]MBN3830379.1 5-oxoprolinase subunit PxpA [Burkholderia sp. Ac-20344]